MDDIPIDLNKILSIDLSNLITVINFLHQNSIGLNQRINQLSNKLDGFTQLKEDLENFKIKSDLQNKKLEEIQTSYDNLQSSMLNYETKINALDEKVSGMAQNFEQMQVNSKTNEDKVNSHETNLNNLNRVVEEQIKLFEKEQEKNEDNIKLNTEKFTKLVTDISSLETKLEGNVKNISNLIEITNSKNKELNNKINKKVVELENNVLGLVSKTKKKDEGEKVKKEEPAEEEEKKEDGLGEEQKEQQNEEKEEKNALSNEEQPNLTPEQNSSLPNEVIVTQNVSTNQNTLNLPSEEVKKINSQISEATRATDSLRVQYNQSMVEINLKIKALQDSVSKIAHEDPFSDLEIPQDQITPEIISEPVQIAQKTPEPIEIPTIDVDNNNESEVLKKLVDSVRLIGQTLDGKVTKDEINVMNKNLTKALDKLTQKLNASLQLYDAKFATMSAEGGKGGSDLTLDIILQTLGNQIDQKISEQVKDIVQNEVATLDFTTNPKIQEFAENIANHTDELNKAFESIVDIRKNLISKDIETVIESLKGRVDEYEITCRKLKFDLDEILKQLEGDPGEEKVDDNEEKKTKKQGSLREHINVIGQRVIAISSAFEKLEKKVENLNRDILIIVKRDLKAESNRILEEFKGDLKASISKIEEQLRNKVDRFGLVEFGQRIDSKFSNEMRSKIDKGDLSKNNHYINRKIDNLENKISKTLVDTLIDLQLDEAPLMIKKNVKYADRCASCNQVLPQNNTYKIKTNISANLTKLPEIHP